MGMRKSGVGVLVPAAVVLCGVGLAAPAHADGDGIWERSNLLGDMGGLRPWLAQYGATLSITDSENLLGNVSGGVKRGATMQGVTTATLQVDTGKAFGWQGGTFNASMLQLHGNPITSGYLDDIQAANGNEGTNATRLWELWFDQSFDYGKADFKIGQQSIDNEFMVSKYSGLFVNTMAGWPLIPSDDLYAGGPAYPLSSLGARIQYKPTDNETILAGVFDDNPPGGAFDNDPQTRDNGGVLFNLNTGALFIAEFQYAVNQPAVGQNVGASDAGQGLPGTYKIGFWYDTGKFADQGIGDDGLSLGDPASDGAPINHHGNFSIYGVMDQTVWQAASGSRSVNVFARLMGAPADRNFISFSANGGVTMTAPFASRPNDTVGLDFGYAHVSGRLSDMERVSALANPGTLAPIQGSEELFELSYQAQVVPWLVVQPDLQYVVNPGGGVVNPGNPNEKLHNELVVGARAIVTF